MQYLYCYSILEVIDYHSPLLGVEQKNRLYLGKEHRTLDSSTA